MIDLGGALVAEPVPTRIKFSGRVFRPTYVTLAPRGDSCHRRREFVYRNARPKFTVVCGSLCDASRVVPETSHQLNATDPPSLWTL